MQDVAPSNGSSFPALCRRITLGGFVLTAIGSALLLLRDRWTYEQLPWLLLTSAAGIATTITALLGLRGASRKAKAVLISASVVALALAGTDLFWAWMIAIFPKC